MSASAGVVRSAVAGTGTALNGEPLSSSLTVRPEGWPPLGPAKYLSLTR